MCLKAYCLLAYQAFRIKERKRIRIRHSNTIQIQFSSFWRSTCLQATKKGTSSFIEVPMQLNCNIKQLMGCHFYLLNFEQFQCSLRKRKLILSNKEGAIIEHIPGAKSMSSDTALFCHKQDAILCFKDIYHRTK